jgi:hypothetical protein
VLLPKCPLCLAAYAGALGALGLSPAAHQWLVEPLIALTALGSFGLVATLSLRRRDVVTPVISAAGVLLVLLGRFALDGTAVTAGGALLLVAAALANAMSCRRFGSRSQLPR